MFRYWMVIGIFIISPVSVLVAEGEEHTFELQWQAEGESAGFSQVFDSNLSFVKEPFTEGHEVYRGALNYHGQTGEPAVVGFLWDKTQQKLYVDLNKDGDLTNDPNGILDNERNGYPDYQEFPAFPLSFSTDKGLFRYRITAHMQGYEFVQQATFRVRSGYSGRIDLYDQTWQFGVNDRLQGSVREGSILSVLPEGEDLQNKINSLPATSRLFLDGHCYTVSFEFKKSDSESPVLWCTLTEQDVSLGTLHIEGQQIHELVLGTGDMLVLPPLSERSVSVPAGDYTCRAVRIQYDEQKRAFPEGICDIAVTIAPDGEGLLKVGGPLQNTVRVERTGNILKFHYELKGIGGETYDARQITNYDNQKVPSVAIYKGNLQLASGTFEYG